MTTAASDYRIISQQAASAPALQAADRGVASSLESVLSDNTRRTYTTQWRIFDGWCDEVGLRSMPAEPLTVARYLAARGGLRRFDRHVAPGRVGHLESPPVGEGGLTLPGPGCARLSKRMGTAPFQAPAPVRSSHRRRTGRDSAHRRPASQARPRHRDSPAGRGKSQV